MKIEKAVIPAAGYGTRMLPLTKAQPKEMLPVVHKPIIQYVVEEAYYSGIREILIITGKHKRAIEDHFDKSDHNVKNEYMEELDRILDDTNIFFVRQREQRGLGDAVRYAKTFVNGHPFVLLLGDNITMPPCTEYLIKYYNRYHSTIIALEEVSRENISRHGIVEGKEIEKDVYVLTRLLEKPSPEETESNLAIIGRYVIMPEIFDILDSLPPGRNNEIQLTDALHELSKQQAIYGFKYPGERFDVGNKVDWLRANLMIARKYDEFLPAFE